MMAMMVEIDKAYGKLNKDDKVVLFYKYVESLDYGDIAKEMELGSEDAARMRHNRAIKKLITRIGGFKPYLERDSSEKIEQHSEGVEQQVDTADNEDRHE
jgi:DNA-directed RNA polymerase specialized sigma24 family protein